MKKVFVLIAVLSLMLFSAGISFAASGSADNMPGGAGVAMFRVGSGYQTLINIQHRPDPSAWFGPATATFDGCALIHVSIYDMNSTHIIDFNLPMTNRDNVGIVLVAGSTAGSINIYDYSDGAFGGGAATNDFSSGIPVVAAAPALANGDVVGYVTMVKTNVTCAAAGPVNNITGLLHLQSDSLIIRTAQVSASSAYAFNSPMLQGFMNIPAGLADSEAAADFVNTFAGAPAAINCDANSSGGAFTTLAIGGSLDDGNGANIDFWELLITNTNGAQPIAAAAWAAGQGIVCDDINVDATGERLYNALGVPGFAVGNPSNWWGRFNISAAAGTSTSLVLVSPNYAPRALYSRNNNLSVLSYNDAEVPVSFGPIPVPEVSNIAFGSAAGNINPGTAVAGEALITYNVPAFGYTYTTGSGFADLYPLVRDMAAANACDGLVHTNGGVAIAMPVGTSCVVVGP